MSCHDDRIALYPWCRIAKFFILHSTFYILFANTLFFNRIFGVTSLDIVRSNTFVSELKV